MSNLNNDSKFKRHSKMKYVSLELLEHQKLIIDRTFIALESIYNFYITTFIHNYPKPLLSPSEFIFEYLYSDKLETDKNGRQKYYNKRIPSSSKNMQRISINKSTCGMSTIRYILRRANMHCYILNRTYNNINQIKLNAVYYNHETNPLDCIFLRHEGIKFVKNTHEYIKIPGIPGEFKLHFEITDNSLITLKDFSNKSDAFLYYNPNELPDSPNEYRLAIKIPFSNKNENNDRISLNGQLRYDYIMLFSISRILISIFGPDKSEYYVYNPLYYIPKIDDNIWYISSYTEYQKYITIQNKLLETLNIINNKKILQTEVINRYKIDYFNIHGIDSFTKWEAYIKSVSPEIADIAIKTIFSHREVQFIRHDIETEEKTFISIMNEFYDHCITSFLDRYNPYLIIMPKYEFEKIMPDKESDYISAIADLDKKCIITNSEYAYYMHSGAAIKLIFEDTMSGMHQNINYISLNLHSPKLSQKIFNCDDPDQMVEYSNKVLDSFLNQYDYPYNTTNN